NDTTGVVGLGAVKALPTLMIYPNPASDFIVVSGIENNSVVKVFNVTGQQLYVRRADQNQLSIDLNGLNQGLYILQVESEGQVINSKFIKK
ncbi:MAG TPA: T9SS type A sorting domain-containing protein, partial [Bacteroidales bacterium]|nr:T9SS type A sorting domain-containing protein [Bacteroidales bacterium]